MRVNVNQALSGCGFLKIFSITYVILSVQRVDVRLVDPEKEEPVQGEGGGGEAPKKSLSRGVSPKSLLTDQILSFRFHDPKTFPFTHINNYLKTEVIELGIILTIR